MGSGRQRSLIQQSAVIEEGSLYLTSAPARRSRGASGALRRTPALFEGAADTQSWRQWTARAEVSTFTAGEAPALRSFTSCHPGKPHSFTKSLSLKPAASTPPQELLLQFAPLIHMMGEAHWVSEAGCTQPAPAYRGVVGEMLLLSLQMPPYSPLLSSPLGNSHTQPVP